MLAKAAKALMLPMPIEMAYQTSVITALSLPIQIKQTMMEIILVTPAIFAQMLLITV
jgi:hypothetical protein